MADAASGTAGPSSSKNGHKTGDVEAKQSSKEMDGTTTTTSPSKGTTKRNRDINANGKDASESHDAAASPAKPTAPDADGKSEISAGGAGTDAAGNPNPKRRRRRRRKSGWDVGTPAVKLPSAPPSGTPLLPSQSPSPVTIAQAQAKAQAQLQAQLRIQQMAQQQIQQRLLQASQPAQQALQQKLAAAQSDKMKRRIYVGSLHYDLVEDHVRVPFSAFGTILKVDMPREPATGKSKGFCFIEFDSEEAAQNAISAMNGFVLAGRQIKVNRPTGGPGGSVGGLPRAGTGMMGMNMFGGMGMGLGMMGGIPMPNPFLATASAAASNSALPRPSFPASSATGTNALLPTPVSSSATAAAAAAAARTIQAVQAAVKPASKCRVYVGSVYWDINADQLRAVFESFGTIKSCELIPDPETGKHRGYGFIEFADEKSAANAIQHLNNFDLCGRKLKVSWATATTTAATGGREQSLKSQENLKIGSNERFAVMQKLAAGTKESRCVVLKNMVKPSEVDDDLKPEVQEECSNFGDVERVEVLVDDAKKDVSIFVLFKSKAAGKKARESLDRRWFGGNVVSAAFYDEKQFQQRFT